MSQVEVNLFSALKEKVGKGKVSVDARNIKDALEKLENKFGDKFREQLYEKGAIKKYYIFLLNGRVIDVKALGQTKLSPGDILHILPPVAGG
jgi:MoaD family protein